MERLDNIRAGTWLIKLLEKHLLRDTSPVIITRRKLRGTSIGEITVDEQLRDLPNEFYSDDFEPDNLSLESFMANQSVEQPNPVTEHRVGEFLITHALINSSPNFLAQYLFSNVIITRAESLFDVHAIKYTGFSSKFDVVEKGSRPPLYEIEVMPLLQYDESIPKYDIRFIKKEEDDDGIPPY